MGISKKITSVDKIRDYVKLCNVIKELDPKIRFAGVINERGRLVAGGMKEGVKPLERQKEDEVLFMELALKAKMRKEFDKQLGSVNFAMSLREKTIAMSFPIVNSDILYVFTDPNVDYQKLVDTIFKIIRK
ncbi:MAG: DUF6659 family protein [Nitrosopumilus sp.]